MPISTLKDSFYKEIIITLRKKYGKVCSTISYQKREKYPLHDTKATRQPLASLEIAIYVMIDFRIWPKEVKQACLQPAQSLMSKFYLKTKKALD